MTYRRFTIRDDVYDTSIHVFLNCEYETVKAAMDRQARLEGKVIEWDEDDIEYYNSCEAAYLHQSTDIGSVKRAIWLQEFDRSDASIVRLSHEIMHAAMEVLQERNVEYSEGSEEAFVRYHDFLFTKILAKV